LLSCYWRGYGIGEVPVPHFVLYLAKSERLGFLLSNDRIRVSAVSFYFARRAKSESRWDSVKLAYAELGAASFCFALPASVPDRVDDLVFSAQAEPLRGDHEHGPTPFVKHFDLPIVRSLPAEHRDLLSRCAKALGRASPL
jgi:hypothetical protein